MADCLFCGKANDGLKYCNKTCNYRYENAKKIERRKKERLERIAQNPTFCTVCHELIENPYHQQSVHKGDCKRIRQLEYKALSHSRKREAIPVIVKTCECGRTFVDKATGRRTRCGTTECYNMRQRMKAKKARSAVAMNKQAMDNYWRDKAPEQKVACKCIGCGTIFMQTFQPAWIGNGQPRVKCKMYPACMSRDHSDSFYAIEFSNVYEMDNCARL